MSWLDDLRGLLGQAQQPLRNLVPNAPQAMENLGSSLSQSGQAIAGLPGNLTRGVGTTLGQLASGNDAAPDTARRTISSVLFPDQGVAPSEVLQNAGVASPTAGQSFAAGILTDPSALVAGAQLGTAAKNLGVEAPAFMRSVLSRGGAPAVEAAAPAGQTLRGQGLNTYITDARGQNFIQPPMPSPRPINNFGANGEQLFNNGSTQMSQAEQWGAQRAGMGVTEPTAGIVRPSASPSAAEGVLYKPPTSSGIPISDASPSPQSLADLRRQFTVVRDAGLGATNQPTFGRMAGPASYRAASQEVENLLQNPGYGGQYNPSSSIAAIRQGALPGTDRHEIFHGLMDAARNSGDSGSLSLPARLSNAMQTSRSPLLQGLGYAGEEGLAHGVQQGRGVMDQLRGAWNFFDKPPSPIYGDLIGDMSPAAGYIYRNRLIPQAVRGAGLAGAGAAAYGAGNAIMGE